MEVYVIKLQLVESYLIVVFFLIFLFQCFGFEIDFGFEGWVIGDMIDVILFEFEIFSEMLSCVKYNVFIFQFFLILFGLFELFLLIL